MNLTKKQIIDLVVCMEELAELQQAISKVIRGKEDIDNLHEEVADVEICLDKVYDICNINQECVFNWKEYKLRRLKLRGDV